MFPQTSNILQDSNVASYDNPEDIGIKAIIYLLIGAKLDEYFQGAIKKCEEYDDNHQSTMHYH